METARMLTRPTGSRWLCVLALGFAPVLIPRGAHAQQPFPTRAVHLIVPFAAGGALDSLTRVIANELQTRWSQPVVVENRVGASGNLGTAYVAHAEPDGHTLLVSPPPPLVINRFLFKSMLFNPSDLAVVTILSTAPNVLVARPAIPVTNLPDLITLAKASPGKLTYASTGRGGTPHLTMEWLKFAAGMDMVHVPYAKGFAPALSGLLGANVDLMFGNLSDIKHLVRSGQLKAVAVASEGPVEELNDVVPMSRHIPGFVSTTWFAVAAPASTPEPILKALARDVSEAIRTPQVTDRLEKLSLRGVGNTPEEAAAFVREDVKRWQSVIKLIGLEPE
jgi:tripartite-type tricarboxylate transporter receptor subunit TctC